MDQNLLPYRALLTAKERSRFYSAFALALGFLSLAVVAFVWGVISLAFTAGNLYAYLPLIISAVLLCVAFGYSAKRDAVEREFYSTLRSRFSERLLMDYGLVAAHSLPPLGLPLNFSGLNNEPVKAVIYLSKSGDIELHRLETIKK